MMYGELYQYFIQHKQLSVPGIGTFLLERKPAIADFPNRIINAPSYTIALQPNNAAPSKNFFSWLSQVYHISEREAVIRFNDFVYDIKQQLSRGDTVAWEGVGRLSPGLAGEIKFDPALNVVTLESPVKAEKVIREKSEHTVRVGEDERTSAQMIELLNQPTTKKRYWWAWALILGLVIIMFLGWYFSVYGLQSTSAGNTQKIKTEEPRTTYKAPS